MFGSYLDPLADKVLIGEPRPQLHTPAVGLGCDGELDSWYAMPWMYHAMH